MLYVMQFFIYILFCFFCLFGSLALYTRLYFRPVSAVRFSKGSATLISMIPSPANFKELKKGNQSSFVHIGSDYYAFYVDSSDPDEKECAVSNLKFPSYVIIFKRNGLGRFVNVDLNNRILFDTLKKFIEE